MRMNTKTIPPAYKERYEAVMSKDKSKDGNKGKKLEMNELCKVWYVNMCQKHGGVDGKKATALIEWGNNTLTRKKWAKSEQQTEDLVELLPWGMVCGKFGGEDAAVAAMKRKEIKKAKNPDYDANHPDDEPEFLYKIKSKYGTTLKNI